MIEKTIVIDANFGKETRVVVLDKNNNVDSFEYDTDLKKQIKNNIYLAVVTRVEPSLQAAFVDYGDGKSGFLPFAEIHPDYYNIPVSDKVPHIQSLTEISPPKITNEDLVEEPTRLKTVDILDSDEIDIEEIKKLVDEKIQSDFNIDVEESDVDTIDKAEKVTNEYKIQEVIKKGQVLLVQVTKEERGNKGASLTTYISLAGKYCVLIPNKPAQNGISRKISNNEERRRLKSIINSLISEDNKDKISVIVRTAGAGHTTLDIKRDYDYLTRLWNKIREVTLKSTAPCFIHQEDSVLLRTVRDLFDKNVKKVLVQGQDSYNQCLKFVRDIMPTEQGAVKEYKSKTPIFTKYNVEEQLSRLYQTTVHLPSGGYIVINPTEALISIDVNSGKSTSERNIEEMALKTNLEAAREIARQARLRDLSGLLVLDFIDMNEVRNRKIVERTLREFFSKDKARIQISSISAFGLLEMSRQRLRPSFLEVNTTMCSHCSGKGVVRADEANSMLILRTIENEIFDGNYDVVNVYGIASSIIYLLNNRRDEINFIEQKHSTKLNFFIDKDATSDSYAIEKVKLSDKSKAVKPARLPILQDISKIYNDSEISIGKSKKKIEKNSNAGKNQVAAVVEPVVTVAADAADTIMETETAVTTELKDEKTFKKNANSRKRINRKAAAIKKRNREKSKIEETN